MGIEAKRKNITIILLFTAVVLGAIISLCLGRYPISIDQLMGAVFNTDGSLVRNIIINVRLPRIIMAVLLGSALSVAGASYQGIFKNPMVSPSLLGVSSGAGFGAALGIILNLKNGGIQASAFVFGFAAVGIVYIVSKFISKKIDHTLSLVLTGIVISSLFVSLLSLLKYIGDPYNDLPAITFWMLGSLSDVVLKDIFIIGIPVVVGMAVLWVLKYKMNIMTFEEDEALSLGVQTGKIRGVIILASTVITAAVVSVSGMVSWVGLVIPHIARMIVGADYRKSLPASIALGALFMLLLDDISRVCFAAEIPLGILTSLLGTPFFIYLMIRGKKSW